MRCKLANILMIAAAFAVAGPVSADDMEVNVRDHGAMPDAFTDNTLAFRKAIDAASAKLAGRVDSRAIVRVPGGPRPYFINRPIGLDVPNVWIVGDGPQSTIQNIAVGPAIVVGVRDREAIPARPDGMTTVQLPEEARPSRLGVLDGSFGGKALRTLGTSSVVFSGGPFDLGPPDPASGLSNWSVQTLVVDMAIERNADGGRWTPGKVEGIAMLGGYDSPPTFRIQKGGGESTVDLLLTDSAGNSGTVSARVGDKTIKRMSIQVDLPGKKAYAWSDRIRVPATVAGPAFGASGSGRLLANKKDSFLLGVTPQTADGRPPLASPGADLPDWTYWGFSLAAYPKYRTDPVGSPQSSQSGAPVNDSYCYGIVDSRIAASLFGQTDSMPGSRYVDGFSGTNGYRAFMGYQIQRDQYLVWGGQSKNGIKGLQLIAPSNRMAPTVQLFSLLNFTAEDCVIRGGTQAIGIVPALATYPVRIRNCRMEGLDSCISAAWSTVDVDHCDFDRIGRTGINAWSSDLTVERAKMWFLSPHTEHIVANRGGYYGGHTVVSNLLADFEEYPVKVSPFFVSQTRDLMTTLVVNDAYLAHGSGGKPLVRAEFAPNLKRPFVIDLSRIDTAGYEPSKIVDSDRPIPGSINGKPIGE